MERNAHFWDFATPSVIVPFWAFLKLDSFKKAKGYKHQIHMEKVINQAAV